MDVVLSIAGSDSCAGAGIQADLKAIAAQGAYGVTAVTAITAQNTQGVRAVSAVSVELLEQQLGSLFDDLPIAAVKTGLLATASQVRGVAAFLRAHPVDVLVVDPVMVATSGDRLQAEDCVAAMRQELLPLATVCTPNHVELTALVGKELPQTRDVVAAAQQLIRDGSGAVVVTGGDRNTAEATDVLVEATRTSLLGAPRVDTTFTHGTGCTFSSALACGLAAGAPLQAAVVAAKAYVSEALQNAIAFGNGRGALEHFGAIRSRELAAVPERSNTRQVTVGEYR